MALARGAPLGNKNALCNTGGSGAPLGNNLALDNTGGAGAPLGNKRARKLYFLLCFRRKRNNYFMCSETIRK